jgi:hypothetical protein
MIMTSLALRPRRLPRRFAFVPAGAAVVVVERFARELAVFASLDDLDAPYERIAVLLEDGVVVMQRRAGGLADGLIRKHVPTTEEPLIPAQVVAG